MTDQVFPPEGRQPMSFGTQLGILTGLFFGGFIIAQIVVTVILLPYVEMSNLNLDEMINFSDPGAINGMKAGQLIAAILTFIVPAWLFCRITRKAFFNHTGLHTGPGLKPALLVPFVIIFSLPLIAWTAELNKLVPLPDFLLKLEEDAEKLTRLFLKSEGPGDLFINLTVVAVMAALSEEIFFRGCLQKVLAGIIRNYHAVIWVTAIIFSLVHMQFHGFIPRMILGAVMGYLFVWTGSLWAPILAHFINNGLGVYLNYLSQRGVIPEEVETYGSSASDWLGIVLGTLLMIAALYLVKKTSREPAPAG